MGHNEKCVNRKKGKGDPIQLRNKTIRTYIMVYVQQAQKTTRA